MLSLLSIPPEEALSEIGTSGYIIETVTAAVYCFSKTPKDFSASVLSAVSAGDDADSVACLTGAFSGAYNGISGIPLEWLSQLEDREWLMRLAGCLHTLSSGKSQSAV